MSVAISPAYAFVPPSTGTPSTQQFFATVTGSSNASVTWSVQSAVAAQGCVGSGVRLRERERPLLGAYRCAVAERNFRNRDEPGRSHEIRFGDRRNHERPSDRSDSAFEHRWRAPSKAFRWSCRA